VASSTAPARACASARPNRIWQRAGSSAADNGWAVKADCEELGVAEAYELAVSSNADGSVAVLNEDVWGPEPIIFQLCPK